jgi:POT family proton-dependent oligopeptide transporter
MFGHPRGLFVLFMTEMWERMSFYGMKALLILYMLNYLVWNQERASEVMAWYAGLVYFTPALGGILADKVFGARWSVVIGGVLMCIGHFLLAFEPLPFFYSGLGFLIVGCGLLKPNISTQVGSLYPRGDRRRDAAFTIFYMGINLGAFIGPLVCGWLRLTYGFHYGFAAAGVGMALGLVVYLFGMRTVEREAAAAAAAPPVENSSAHSQENVPRHVTRDRIIVLFVVFAFALVFWMAFEQAANVMTVWADKNTNLHVFRAEAPLASVQPELSADGGSPRTWRDWQMGAEFLQSVNPLFIVALGGVFAGLWMWLDRRKKQPSTPAKMTIAMFGMTLAYVVMLVAAARENAPTSVPLSSLPATVQMDEQQRLYTFEESNEEKKDKKDPKRVYYGNARLQYDASAGKLLMEGVLSDLDWLRLLGQSAPPAYRTAIKELLDDVEKRHAQSLADARDARKRGESPDPYLSWEVSAALPADLPAPEWNVTLPEKVSWDAVTRTIRVGQTLSERDKLALYAGGAEPEFRAAVNKIYVDSSVLKVSVLWLVLFYLTCTMAELCLSPVGLSLVTKMAPARHVGLFMGLWFVTTGGIANFAAHTIGGYWDKMTPTQYFLIFGAMALITALIMVTVVKALKRRMHGIQ